MVHHTLGWRILPVIVLALCASCREDSEAPESCVYRLTRGAYSPITNTLLVVAKCSAGDLPASSFLVAYDEGEGAAEPISCPSSPGLFDFAWIPGQPAFVVSHRDKITVFRKNAFGKGYTETALRCPDDVLNLYCSWSPTGRWLAMMCNDIRSGSGFRLGLYDANEKRCVVSQIIVEPLPPVWKDEDTLQVTYEDNALEVRVEGGTPKVSRTIPIEQGVTWFYGMLNDRALVQKDKRIRLGNKTLIELDADLKFRVIATETTIFVSASPRSLAAFDHEGRKIDRINPRGLVQLGAIGKNADTIYGLTDSAILHICVTGGRIRIREVCDLADLMAH